MAPGPVFPSVSQPLPATGALHHLCSVALILTSACSCCDQMRGTELPTARDLNLPWRAGVGGGSQGGAAGTTLACHPGPPPCPPPSPPVCLTLAFLDFGTVRVLEGKAGSATVADREGREEGQGLQGWGEGRGDWSTQGPLQRRQGGSPSVGALPMLGGMGPTTGRAWWRAKLLTCAAVGQVLWTGRGSQEGPPPWLPYSYHLYS